MDKFDTLFGDATVQYNCIQLYVNMHKVVFVQEQ